MWGRRLHTLCKGKGVHIVNWEPTNKIIEHFGMLPQPTEAQWIEYMSWVHGTQAMAIQQWVAGDANSFCDCWCQVTKVQKEFPTMQSIKKWLHYMEDLDVGLIVHKKGVQSPCLPICMISNIWLLCYDCMWFESSLVTFLILSYKSPIVYNGASYSRWGG